MACRRFLYKVKVYVTPEQDSLLLRLTSDDRTKCLFHFLTRGSFSLLRVWNSDPRLGEACCHVFRRCILSIIRSRAVAYCKTDQHLLVEVLETKFEKEVLVVTDLYRHCLSAASLFSVSRLETSQLLYTDFFPRTSPSFCGGLLSSLEPVILVTLPYGYTIHNVYSSNFHAS